MEFLVVADVGFVMIEKELRRRWVVVGFRGMLLVH